MRRSNALYIRNKQRSYYGITNFYVADDTHESNEKLELLAKVVQLDYKPNLVAFARLDVLSKRPEQIPLLKQANVVGLNFGIETLSKEAAKGIRKGYDFEGFIRHYKQLERKCQSVDKWLLYYRPSWRHKTKILTKLDINKQRIAEQYLMGELQIEPWVHRAGEVITYDEGWLSDMDKDPGKIWIQYRS